MQTESCKISPMRWMPVVVVALSLVLPLVSSCNSSGCTDNQNSLPLAGFYSDEGKAITLSDIDISGVGVPGDSLLYASGTSLSQAYFPLRSNAETTAYCLHYTQEGIDDVAFNDTLTFSYSSTPYFASEECGAMLRYHIKSLRYTTHIIDSVALLDSLITNVDVERIKIFFRTSQ